jgi:thymidine kinase
MKESYLNLEIKSVEECSLESILFERDAFETSQTISEILSKLSHNNIAESENMILIRTLGFFREKLINQVHKIEDSGKRFYYHNLIVSCDDFLPESEKSEKGAT